MAFVAAEEVAAAAVAVADDELGMGK